MQPFTLAKQSLTTALEQASQEGIAEGDLLHAMLVTLVERCKESKGMEDTRSMLEFQINNLSDDEEYAFMRP